MRSGGSSKTETGLSLVGGALLGAAVMYLLDPENGRSRRDQFGEKAGDALGTAWDRTRDASATLAAKAAEVSSRLADRASELSGNVADEVSDRAGDVRSGGAAALHGLRSRLGDFAQEMWDKARHLGHGASEHAVDTARGISGQAGDWAQDWADRARGMSHPARHRLARALDPDHVRGGGHAVGYSAAGLGTLIAGAGLMYFLDPERGPSRRAWASQKTTRILNDTGTTFRRTGRDWMNRARGKAHQARGLVPFGSREDADGERVLERVRSEIGRVLTHPTQVQLMADADGAVTLYGRVPASEADKLLSTVSGVTGVNQVINRLEVCNTLSEVTGAAAGSGNAAPQM